jgi:hypothetical protein
MLTMSPSATQNVCFILIFLALYGTHIDNCIAASDLNTNADTDLGGLTSVAWHNSSFVMTHSDGTNSSVLPLRAGFTGFVDEFTGSYVYALGGARSNSGYHTGWDTLFNYTDSLYRISFDDRTIETLNPPLPFKDMAEKSSGTRIGAIDASFQTIGGITTSQIAQPNKLPLPPLLSGSAADPNGVWQYSHMTEFASGGGLVQHCVVQYSQADYDPNDGVYQNIIALGGLNVYFNNEVYSYNPNALAVMHNSQGSYTLDSVGLPVQGHSCHYVQGNIWILFGKDANDKWTTGMSSAAPTVNDGKITELHITTYSGDYPYMFQYHAAAIYNSRYIITAGGVFASSAPIQVWQFDTSSLAWTQLGIDSAISPANRLMAMLANVITLDGCRNMYLMGGVIGSERAIGTVAPLAGFSFGVPTMQPVISSIRGCEDESNGNGTRFCPVTGGITLTITGKFEHKGTAILVNGEHCKTVSQTSETVLTCTLPAYESNLLPLADSNEIPVSVSAYQCVRTNSVSVTGMLSYGVIVLSPGTLEPTVLQGTAGGELIHFTGKFPFQHASDVKVVYGEAEKDGTGAWKLVGEKFPCATNITYTTTTRVACTTSKGIGKDLHVQVSIGPLVSVGSDTLRYPIPFITGDTLRFRGQPESAGKRSLTLQSNDPVVLVFNGGNFGDPSLPGDYAPTVRYGPIDNPQRYDCTIVDGWTNTEIQCRTQSLVSGTNLHFVVLSRGSQLSLTGTDELNYPSSPKITRVRGCPGDYPNSKVNSTNFCPTAGGIVITVHGSDFPFNGQFSIGGKPAPRALNTSQPDSAEIAHIILPPGAGFRIAVSLAGAEPQPFISYSIPFVTSLTGCKSSSSPGNGGLRVSGCFRNGSNTLVAIGTNFGASGAQAFFDGELLAGVRHDVHDPQTKLYIPLAASAGTRHNLLIAQQNGEFTRQSLQVSFALCPAGTVDSSVSNSSEPCSPCKTGRFTQIPGQSECALCSAGTYAASAGRSTCLYCDTNMFNPSTGKSACSFCDPFKYQPTRKQTTCLSCAPSQYMPGALAANYSANNGNVSRGGIVNGERVYCAPCPVGALCSSGHISSASDYWLYSRPSTGLVESFRCPPGFCMSGSKCAENRPPKTQNIMCGECLPGYYLAGNSCVRCEGDRANMRLVLLLLFATWLFVCALHVLSQSSSGLTKILIYFVQIAVLFVGSSFDWVSALSVFNLNVANSSSQCILPWSPLAAMLTGIWMPLVSMLFLALTAAIHVFIVRVTKRGSFHIDSYIRTLLGLCLSGYVSVTTTIFQFLDCDDIASGISVIADHPGVRCDSSTAASGYNSFLPWSYVLLALIVVGFPLALIAFMILQRHRIAKASPSSHFHRRFGILYEVYTPSCYWWECWAVVRRSILAMLATVLSHDRSSLVMAWILVTFFVYLGQVHLTPYRFDLENRLDMLSQIALLLVVILLVGDDSRQEINVQWAVPIGMIVFATAVGIGFFIARDLLRKYVPKARSKIGDIASRARALFLIRSAEVATDDENSESGGGNAAIDATFGDDQDDSGLQSDTVLLGAQHDRPYHSLDDNGNV